MPLKLCPKLTDLSLGGNESTVIKVAALCLRDRKLLLVRSRNYQAFFTLGGKLELGETNEQCLIREVQEEVGCEVISSKYFGTFEGLAHDKTRNVRLICYFVELKKDPIPSSEIAEIHWWGSPWEAPRPRDSYC